MSGNLIFHLLEDPSETWAEDHNLVHCFYKNNPFWTNEGLPLDTEGETCNQGLQNDQPNGVASNLSNESTNSDSQKVSAESKLDVKKFMEYLGNSESKKGKQDRAICNTVMSWVRKKTKDYKSFKEWELPDTRYIAEKLGSAGVPYQTAYDFVKKNYPDVKQEDFDAGYYQGFDQEFREDILRHLNLL